MNDELKKILDYLKDEKWDCYPCEGIPYKVFRMEERDKLLDYISNLQQENENAKKLKERYQLEKEDYESRIDKALAYIYQYREVYYPDEPQSEPVISYNLGIYEEEFDEEKIVNILKGDDENEKR